MKSQIKAILIGILILLASQSAAKDYTLPDKFNGLKPAGKSLYLIGWSKEGHIAYMSYYNIGGRCGYCPMYDLVIYSLVEDKIEKKESFSGDENPTYTENFPKTWKINYPKIKKLLENYHIAQYQNFEYWDKNFKFKNSRYSFKVNAEEESENLNCCGRALTANYIFKLQISILSSKLGSKNIHTFNDDGIAGKFKNPVILGVIKSPFEDRVAVLYSFTPVGCDTGGENFRFIGAHLVYGFKK